VIEQQGALGLEVAEEVVEGFLVLVSRASQAEGAAENDGLVEARNTEFVKGLLEEAWSKAFGSRAVFTMGEHVCGDIAAVDLEA
jgi:hypothetical protein